MMTGAGAGMAPASGSRPGMKCVTITRKQPKTIYVDVTTRKCFPAAKKPAVVKIPYQTGGGGYGGGLSGSGFSSGGGGAMMTGSGASMGGGFGASGMGGMGAMGGGMGA